MVLKRGEIEWTTKWTQADLMIELASTLEHQTARRFDKSFPSSNGVCFPFVAVLSSLTNEKSFISFPTTAYARDLQLHEDHGCKSRRGAVKAPYWLLHAIRTICSR